MLYEVITVNARAASASSGSSVCAAAADLGMLQRGVVDVRAEVLELGRGRVKRAR